MTIIQPKIYQGNTHTDERGNIRFVNDFEFKDVKRFYQIENAEKDYVRAFHGHEREAKYVHVVTGSILIYAIYVENFQNPSKDSPINKFFLSETNPQVLYIPPHYANGFKTLEKHTKVIFYSTSLLKESEEDDYRIASNFWGDELWKIA